MNELNTRSGLEKRFPLTLEQLQLSISVLDDSSCQTQIATFFSRCVKNNNLVELKKLYASSDPLIKAYATRYLFDLDRFDTYRALSPRIAAFLVKKCPTPAPALLKFLSMVLGTITPQDDDILFSTLQECEEYVSILQPPDLHYLLASSSFLKSQSQYRLVSIFKIDQSHQRICDLLHLDTKQVDLYSRLGEEQKNNLCALRDKLALQKPRKCKKDLTPGARFTESGPV